MSRRTPKRDCRKTHLLEALSRVKYLVMMYQKMLHQFLVLLLK